MANRLAKGDELSQQMKGWSDQIRYYKTRRGRSKDQEKEVGSWLEK